MAALLPASVYGLKVPTGGMPIPAAVDFPATFRITMAAIDPSAVPDLDAHLEGVAPRATLRLIRQPLEKDDEDSESDYDDDDIEKIKARLEGVISDEEDSEDDEEDSEDEKNGGPSDKAKAEQAKKEAMTKKLQEALDEEMEIDDAPHSVNGAKSSKGKGKAVAEDDTDSDNDDGFGGEMEVFVLCTLDPEKNFQQPLDITVGEHEAVYFAVNGTHDIYLTGNYVIPPDDDSEDDEDYDSDELDDMYGINGGDESDEEDEEEDTLDGLQDPRITEIVSDEEEAPKLVKADKKGKNKRPAQDSDDAETLDDLISKATKPTNGEEKASKKQAKKLKKNDGQAVAATETKKDQKDAANGDKKKVQFAKNLEQGPTGSPKAEGAKAGPKVVNGVTIDDKKLGKGPAAKKGDKIEMRYIGKLKNGKVFDSNKKGKPFSFKLGSGEVIKGWDIGIAGMAVGGERRITVPAHHAYGKQTMPGIPANSELIFDVKCLAIR